MFALIVILLSGTSAAMDIKASHIGTFGTFQECFAARESFSRDVFGMPQGYYPPNMQAVCIPMVFAEPS